MSRRAFALCAALVALSAAVPAASAQQWLPRNFPADALRGALVVQAPPEVTIDGRAARLAPGARIRADNNMMVLSGSVIGTKLLVHYTIDPFGLVKDVWILRPEEAEKFWPRSAEEAEGLLFDPLSQTWSRP